MAVQETSEETYHIQVLPTLSKRQLAVVEQMRRSGPVTNQELAYALGWPINTVTPRVFELRKRGTVVEHCRRIDKNTRRRAICWWLAEFAQPNLI